jgi:DNA mismatch repair protein MSH4
MTTDMLAIQEGRHPIKEIVYNGAPKNQGYGRNTAPSSMVGGVGTWRTYVPNNTYTDGGSSFQLITGANSSGKTTYLKQVALIVLMAHLGCYVPAEMAMVRLTGQIYSRMATGDFLSAGASTFMLEMREMAYILRNVLPATFLEYGDEEPSSPTEQGVSKPLIIVDELGRGTSSQEGLGIAYAVAEALIHSNVQNLWIARTPFGH